MEIDNPLTFWLGTWEVRDAATGEYAGSNEITASLDGAAVLERWHGASGVDGMSLFYFDRVAGLWRQAWATNVGYAKQKTQVVTGDPARVVFQGVVRTPDGGEVRDRTTLTDRGDGRVRQVIEVAPLEGEWETGFDAIYTARGLCARERANASSR